MKMDKKGQVFDQLAKLGIGVATIAIILVVTFLVIAQAKEQTGTVEGIDTTNQTQCETSTSCNATNTLTDAVGTIPGWIPLVIITTVGAILLGLVALFRR